MEPLGNKLREYDLDVWESIRHILFGLLGIGMGTFLVVVTITLLSNQILYVLVGPVMGIAFILYSLWLIGQVIFVWLSRPKIVLYENGISQSIRGKDIQVWTWNDFSEMKGVMLKYRFLGLFNLLTEGKLQFKGPKNNLTIYPFTQQAAELADLIVVQITNILLPNLIIELDGGETLKFGNVALTKTSITKGKTTIALRDILGYERLNNIVFVVSRKMGQRIRLNIRSIPNYPILVRIMDQIRGIQGSLLP